MATQIAPAQSVYAGDTLRLTLTAATNTNFITHKSDYL